MSNSTVKITVNGQEVEADPKKPLIHACHTNSVDVPHYCYHPGLTPVGSCRICQVEVKQGEMPSRVMVACRTPVAEGMVVNTESEGAHETRRECLEILLKNHPLDCPICDKAGECTLQDYTFEEGQGMARTEEPRRKLEKRKDLGDVIVLDQERCILCSRCVRFMEEVPKTPQLTVAGRGSHSTIETFMDRPLTGNYQGNLADVCPVGALTLKEFRFRARVWNLHKVASTCGECSRGCSTTVEVLRKKEVKRIRPRVNEDVNGHWMCDIGRFSMDPLNEENRLAGAALRGNHGMEARDTQTALESSADMLRVGESCAVLLSPFVTQEEGALAKELANAVGGEVAFLSPKPNEHADDLLHTGDPCPNRQGLTDLGMRAVSAAEASEFLSGARVGLVIGDRMDSLLGEEAIAALPHAMRLIMFTTVPAQAASVDVNVGMPNIVERSGSWINVDGKRGIVQAARSAPEGVWPLTRSLETLCKLVSPSPQATQG
ncbi:MAG: NADH-quinone oxidoreductase subunit G [Planctomycetota bacterium]|jgi:NADH-quinone oxidoreductase subunit G